MRGFEFVWTWACDLEPMHASRFEDVRAPTRGGNGPGRCRCLVTRVLAFGLAFAAACGTPASTSDGLSADAPATDADTRFVDAPPIDADAPPLPPANLLRWLRGNPADRVTTATSGLILMGGGPDVDAAFAWQRERIGGGDVVVLRASGADGYNDYLFDDIGGVDSVETLRLDTRALALDPYVKWTLDHAEAVFLAGGDQAIYVAAWGGTPVSDALAAAWTRGTVLGGTSAGCAFLAGYAYTASAGSVTSVEALADPYDPYVTLARDIVSLPPLATVITDTHFRARDRMGRLVTFAARAITDGWTARPLALGVDEGTALVVDETGLGTVLGADAVYAVAPQQAPSRCTAGSSLAWSNVPVYELRAGDTIALPTGTTTVAPSTLSVTNGALVPANPY